MRIIKLLIRKIIGEKLFESISLFKLLIINTYIDAMMFFKHSMVFKQNTFNKIESKIILHYHGIEKGFLHEKFRYRFGEKGIIGLIELLKNKEVIENQKRTQILAAYMAICKYYEKHQKEGIDISDYYSSNDYVFFKSLLTIDFDIVKEHNHTEFFEHSKSDFFEFSKSRGSVRNFTGELVSFETINKVIQIAKTAPSVCNRQTIKVYYAEKKEIISRILSLQQGLKGYSDDINQLLIVVSDRNYFYTVGERNQLYIDGGVFLMNLLYALHYYKIGACPAHWGFNYQQDREIQKELGLSDSEKVICLVPIGIPKNEFKTTLSIRRDNEEILKIVNS
ncbi:MAG: nitroreductase [Bacteroidetes bacterium HGW-Bacteroidetes-10]|nr:MAG: nitroreductase [Bacteroidetes bacterium HGW-Bacteroidetes-10]